MSFVLRVTMCKMFMGLLQDLWALAATLTLDFTHLHKSVMIASALSSSNVTTSPSVLKKKKMIQMAYPLGNCKAKTMGHFVLVEEISVVF